MGIERTVTCEVCKKEIRHNVMTGLERCARIERGDFEINETGYEQRDDDNVKFQIYVCQSCFMDDDDLCRFFNKLGHRIR